MWPVRSFGTLIIVHLLTQTTMARDFRLPWHGHAREIFFFFSLQYTRKDLDDEDSSLLAGDKRPLAVWLFAWL